MIAAVALALVAHGEPTCDGWRECRGAPETTDAPGATSTKEWIVHGEWTFDTASWNSKLDAFSELELVAEVGEFELELVWLEPDGTTAKRQRLAVRDERAEVGDGVRPEHREPLREKLEYLAGPVLLRRAQLGTPWRLWVLGGGRRYTEIRRRVRAELPGEEVRLCDGHSLAGWKALGDAKYVVELGAPDATTQLGEFGSLAGIVGEVGGGAQSFLVTEREFGDFVLDVDVRNERPGNSGIQVRSHVREDGRLFGYQLEIDPSPRGWSGGLYDEGRRGWLDDLADDEAARGAFTPGEWNHYRIECHGPWIRAWVNGVATADFLDPLDLSGVLGLQVHSGNDTRVRWANFRLRDLGRRAWRTADSGELVGRAATAGADDTTRAAGNEAENASRRVTWGRAADDFGLRFPWRGTESRTRLYFRVQGDVLETPGPLVRLGPALWRTTSGCFVDLAAEELRSESERTLSLLAFGDRVALFVDDRSLVQARLAGAAREGRFAFEAEGSLPGLPTPMAVLE
ncbi:MAG: DUF1080 domain-containing protein [Planctomycetes bacterium]|nr:DUF1080 domain-containing protein [Planctomycetota bacterium]